MLWSSLKRTPLPCSLRNLEICEAVEIWVPGEQPPGQAPGGISWGLEGVLTPEGLRLPAQSCLIAWMKSDSPVLRPQREVALMT